MKLKIASALVVILAVFGAFFAGRWSNHVPRVPLAHASAPNMPAAPAMAHLYPPPLHTPSVADWQKMRSVRDLTFEKNPDLAAEYKSLLAEIEQQQNSLDDAMIAVDPQVAPIVAKLKALRHRNTATP
jgi:hypothetical protein